MVTISYHDRSDENKVKYLKIKAEEFIRRFMMHILPKSYVRIRYFGFLANKCKQKNLACCRKALNYHPKPSGPVETTARAMMLYLTGEDLNRCPSCKIGTMHISMQLPKMPPINLPPAGIDSS